MQSLCPLFSLFSCPPPPFPSFSWFGAYNQLSGPLFSSPCSFKESKQGLSEVLNIFIKLLLWGLPLSPPASSFSPLYSPTILTNLAPVGVSSKAPAMRLLPATCCAARSCTIASAGPRCVKPGKLLYTRLGHIWRGDFGQAESSRSGSWVRQRGRGGGDEDSGEEAEWISWASCVMV